MISTLQILRHYVITVHLHIPNCLCNVFVVDLVCYFTIWQIILEKVVLELKLLKDAITSRYWWSW